MSEKDRSKKEHSQDIISLHDIWDVVFANKYKIITGAMLGAVLLGGYAYIKAPTYQATAVVNVDTSNQASSTLSAMMSSSSSVFGISQNNNLVSLQIQTMQSLPVLLPVVEKLGMNVSAYPDQNFIIRRIFPQPNALKVMDFDTPTAWISQGVTQVPLTIRVLNKDQYDLIGPDGKVYLAKGEFNKNQSYSYDGVTYSITVMITDLSALQPGDYVVYRNDDIASVNALSKVLSFTTDKDAPTIITVSATGPDPIKLATAVNDVVDEAIKNDIKRSSENARAVLAFLRAQLPIVRQNLNEAENRLTQYREETGTLNIEGETALVLSQLGAFDKQLTQLEQKRAAMSARLTDSNPEIIQLDSAIEKVKQQQVALRENVKTLPKGDQTFINLSRDVQVQNDIYKNLVSAIQQYQMVEAGTVSTLQVIDRATVPYQDLNLSTRVMILLGGILGAFGVAFVLMFRRFMTRNVTDLEQLEEISPLPTVATIMTDKIHSKNIKQMQKGFADRLKFADEIDLYGSTIEAMRSLRTGLRVQSLDRKIQVIAISGPIPNVGKSYCSVNLARALAEEFKVLLIDADIRKGDVKVYFDANIQTGLTDYLVGEKTIDQVIYKTGGNLDFMARGKMKSGLHTSVISNARLSQLLSAVRDQYDYIVIDTSPILPVPDASSVMILSDYNIVVYGYDMHKPKEIELTIKRFSQLKVRTDAQIFNLVPMGDSNGYGYSYKYSYKPENN